MRVLRPVLLAAVLSVALGGVAEAAPIGALKQHRLPTADSQPRSITLGSDGNMWFTSGSEFLSAKIGRITPAGDITEFDAQCSSCIVTDIAQGPGGILYFTSNEAFLGRITTAGEVLAPIPMPNSGALGGNLAIRGDEVWISDFNNDSLWRYDIGDAAFTQYPVTDPGDVAVDATHVWFTAPLHPGVGLLDPATGAVTMVTTTLVPRELTIAADGDVWFTARFTPQGVGEVDSATLAVREFPLTNVGPQGIGASPDGSVWFTQTTKGNIARITDAGVITESKAVKNSEPFGIAVDAGGDPWFTMMAANKIAELQLR